VQVGQQCKHFVLFELREGATGGIKGLDPDIRQMQFHETRHGRKERGVIIHNHNTAM
jgi:hypothetical protein